MTAAVLAACLAILASCSAPQAGGQDSVGTGASQPALASVCVEDALAAAGYEDLGGHVFLKQVASTTVRIEFDVEGRLCWKNQYAFPLAGAQVADSGKLYVAKQQLEDIIWCTIEDEGGVLACTPKPPQGASWAETNPLVAHAGGAYRRDFDARSNSVLALAQNYELGHRVFELDFYLTADRQLACVHDWERYGHEFTAEEWAAAQENGVTDFPTMMLDDVIDQMVANPDMVIVMDTKAFEFESADDIALPFRLVVEQADLRDPSLKDRFVPQIYDNEMYDLLMSVYQFPSVIYTTYATQRTIAEVADFVEPLGNIQVVVVPVEDETVDAAAIERFHGMGKKVYCHTINSYLELCTQMQRGFDGFYTDFLTPADLALRDQLATREAQRADHLQQGA